MENLRKPTFIVTGVLLPLVCVVVMLAGIVGGTLLLAASNSDGAGVASVDAAAVESEVVAIATDYDSSGDIQTARDRLDALGLPNSNQYVSFLVDRYIQETQGTDDPTTQQLFNLADALGVSTESMVAALSTPTPVPTATLPPTATPLPTETPTAVPTEPVAEVAQAEEEVVVEEVVAEEAQVEEEEPTATPVPTETPVPATSTPAPPTNTPEPTETPVPPPPAVDFTLVNASMIPNPTYNSCPGSHQIFVTIVDAAGNPIDGVTVEDTFRAVPGHVSGEKGPGKLEYDLWNNGFALEVTTKADGSPATSDVTPKLSSWDEDIPNDWLVAANYCLDEADCVQRKSSNQLCRGHYSYDVLFQRTY